MNYTTETELKKAQLKKKQHEELKAMFKVYNEVETFSEFRLKMMILGYPKYRKNSIFKFYAYYMMRKRNVDFSCFPVYIIVMIMSSLIISLICAKLNCPLIIVFSSIAIFNLFALFIDIYLYMIYCKFEFELN